MSSGEGIKSFVHRQALSTIYKIICKSVEKCPNQKWDSVLQVMSCNYEDGVHCKYCL